MCWIRGVDSNVLVKVAQLQLAELWFDFKKLEMRLEEIGDVSC
jgi:hypothetical protein